MRCFMKNYLKLFLILVFFSFGFHVAQASEDSSQENIPKHLEKDVNAEDENIPERIEQVFNTESKENQRERFNKVVERVEKGEVQAWYKLAMIYSEGIEEIEVEKDEEKASYWQNKFYKDGKRQQFNKMLERVKKGDVEAWYELAWTYLKGIKYLGVEKDEEKAFYWMEKVTKEGHHVEAQKQLAKMFKLGIGVDKDEEKALSLLEELANQGDDDAQYLLGFELLDRGRVKGSKAEIKEGFKWIKKAAEQGHRFAEDKLNEEIPERIEQAFNTESKENQRQRFNKVVGGVEKGDVQAWYELAMIYLKGIKEIGVERDEGKALFWMNKAMREGHVEAQREITKMYSLGMDDWRDLRGLKKVAADGDAESQYQLGLKFLDRMYYKVRSDLEEYKGYFIEENYRLSQAVKDSEDAKEAFEWIEKAAEQGHGHAIRKLAEMYLMGLGVEQNKDLSSVVKEMIVESFVQGDRWYRDGQSIVVKKMTDESFMQRSSWTWKGQSIYELAKMNSNVEEVFELMQRADTIGMPEAIYDLTRVYVDKGSPEEKEFLRIQKSKGHKYPSTEKEILDRISIAADRGYAPAQYELGNAFSLGVMFEDYKLTSVNRDIEKALYWYTKAALQGTQGLSSPETLKALDRFGVLANPGNIDVRKALRLSANQGVRDFLLAEMYYYGRVVKEDREKAYKLYLEAAAKGHEGAKEALKRKEFQDYRKKTSLSKPDRWNSSCSEIF